MSRVCNKIENKDIKEFIKQTFDLSLDIKGGWGYDKENAVIYSSNMKKEEFFQLFASIRANTELNIFQIESEKYGGINPTIEDIQNIGEYEKVIFKIKAIKKDRFSKLVQEYKDSHQKSSFDIEEHFKQREKATLKLKSSCWFLSQKSKFANVKRLFVQDKSRGLIEKAVIYLDENGVKDDKFYGKNIERSVLLTSFESYKKAKDKDIELFFGQLGENILLDINPCDLKTGQKLAINDTILQITKPCTMCKSLVCIDKRLPKLLKTDRGIFAKVLQSGKICVDDKVTIL